ncbi:MAG: nicotinate phosphoribosyltransferase [Bryobacter sp.]|nr:nicotinate phosphoribosyltransferase [Bryobacter sp.]
MRALFTDFYQLTMTAGYWQAGKTAESATFEMFVRRLPPERDFLVVCGLEQALEYLEQLAFDEDELAYLKELPQFQSLGTAFWDFLRSFRFRGDVYSAPEGTVLFANEPLLTVRAPLAEAQVPETYLLATIGFQTLIATKAARILSAAEGRSVVEFGCRRAHAPEAGCLAGRAAYIAGCAGTSNVEAGFRYSIPVFGTAAHSWVLSFPAERDAFAALQAVLRERTVQLIDTYDTLNGAQLAAELGAPLWGVRLDSGDLLELSQSARRILDEHGLASARIMATNDLDEHSIARLLKSGAPIDVFGVGTSLATSYDAPALPCVYKLVEHTGAEGQRFPYKKSEGKMTLPGRKQIYRTADADWVALASEPAADGLPLIKQVMREGVRTGPSFSIEAAREYTQDQIARFGKAGRPVHYSPALLKLVEEEQ